MPIGDDALWLRGAGELDGLVQVSKRGWPLLHEKLGRVALLDGSRWLKCERLAHEEPPRSTMGSTETGPSCRMAAQASAPASLPRRPFMRGELRGELRSVAEFGRGRLGGAGPRPGMRAELQALG